MSQASQHGRRRLAWGVVLASAWALTACAGGYGGWHDGGYGGPGDRGSDRAVRGGYSGYSEGGRAQERQEVARQAYERDLERRVTAALDADPRTRIESLKVTSVGNGVVKINGSPVNGVIGRDLALRAASRVPGVRSVLNDMTMN